MDTRRHRSPLPRAEPVIFHGVLSFAALPPRAGMARIPRPATSAHSGSKDVLFIASNFIPLMESRTGEFLRRRQAVAVALWAVGTGIFYAGARRFAQRSGYKNERVTRLELATSSLARRCSTTELHPHFWGKQIMSSARRGATF